MIFWGTLVGVLPVVAQHAAADSLAVETPILLGVGLALLLFLFPLSFAYAVVKHRALELPVLLRISARYLLVQRGFTILLAGLSITATMVFAFSFADYLGTRIQAALPVGIALGSGFGSLLLWTGRKVQREVGRKIDRAFFRDAYDVRVILEDLAERIRRATDRKELAGLLEHQLNEALHPSALAIYLEAGNGRLSAAWGTASPETRTIAATQPMLASLARQGRPWVVSERSRAVRAASDLLPSLKPECLVPMLGRDGRLAGLLALGPRLSEEPYSREDLHLLSAVANQAALALESILLGEKIAERIAADRRVAQEMEFARQVQARLSPQKLPRLETLDYEGHCSPARQMGGDYYDFLELQPGRLALVLADIAGKGVSGALLMASLQASLRSQYALALDDPRRLLNSVNHLFCQSTDENSYATLFFADYDDSTQRLRYINCGHLPPVLLRAGASPVAAVERLEPTCALLGMFEEWESVMAEVQLAAGDLPVLYTDGITETTGGAGEEFGESRLIELLRASGNEPLPSLIESIVSSVGSFRTGEQEDDLTLVLARCSR